MTNRARRPADCGGCPPPHAVLGGVTGWLLVINSDGGRSSSPSRNGSVRGVRRVRRRVFRIISSALREVRRVASGTKQRISASAEYRCSAT